MSVCTRSIVYHPDMNVSVDYLQLNSSFVNISVHVAPVPADLETITVLVFSSDGRLVNEQRIRATEVKTVPWHFSIASVLVNTVNNTKFEPGQVNYDSVSSQKISI